MKQLIHGSLFSGIGGFDLAASWLGWHNAFHCEINEFCTAVLKYHFPNAEHYDDITKTDFSKWRGKINVLSGGFPCQPFSVAGQRKGADDDRYLWPQMLRVIHEIRPSWVVGENVAGILTMVQPGTEVEVGSEASLFREDDRKRTLLRQEYVVETVCRDLEREGYSVQPLVIPACAVGAPHRRDRIWFIAHRTDTGIETVQCGGKNGVYAVGLAANTDFSGFQKTRSEQQTTGTSGESVQSATPDIDKCRKRTDEQKPITECKRASGHCNGRENEFAAYSESQQSERYKSEQPTDSTKEQREPGRSNSENYSEYAMQEWDNFPTQSPVCRGNDGLSFNVDDLTIPYTKWRQESIKAYGNAIVPQVVYEIFKAIQETMSNKQY